MSITLSIPPAIVQEVREWAEANGTSLNQYVRDCLAAKAEELQEQRSRKVREFRAFLLGLPPSHAPKGWKFDRLRDGHREIRGEYI